MKWLAAVSAASLVACIPESSAPRVEDVSLVVVGEVRTATGTPAGGAIVHLQAMADGRSGGELGCMGSSLIGDKAGLSNSNGQFVMELGARPIGGTPVCIIALAKRFAAVSWSDTASVVFPFIPRTAVTPPDTVRVDLRLR